MKKLIAILLAMLLLTGCAAAPAAPQEEPAAPETVTEPEAPAEKEPEEEPMPIGSFTADTITGETLNESIFAEADLTILNIWATYCGPCKEEMPILAKIHEEVDGVQVLGIVVDCNDPQGNPVDAQVELAVDLAEAAGAKYHNLLLNMDLAQLGFAAVTAVPATLFIDKDGNTVGYGFYGALDEDSWNDVVEERLETARSRYEA